VDLLHPNKLSAAENYYAMWKFAGVIMTAGKLQNFSFFTCCSDDFTNILITGVG
jgi:hypothetical protein